MRGKWVLIGIGALLAGVLAGAVSLWWQQRQAAVQVVLSEPSAVPEIRELRLEGVIGARNIVSIRPPVPGILEMVMVDVGTEVYEGMPLAQIQNTTVEAEMQLAKEDLSDAEAQLSQLESALIAARLEASRANADLSRAQGEFEEARREFERQQMLYRKGATPRQEYQKAEAESERVRKEYDAVSVRARQVNDDVAEMQRRMDLAKQAMDRINVEIESLAERMAASQVVSPVNGVITGMAARQGEEAHPAMEALFQVAVDLSQLTVTLEPSSPEMELLKPGQPALVYVAEASSQPLEGSVAELTVGKAIVEFANPNPAVRPGLTAQVVVRLSR